MNMVYVLRRLALAVGLTPFLVASNPALGADLDKDIESTSRLVVMIDNRLGAEPAFGAGIVVGRDKERLYIVTANHVVRRGAVEATDIRVVFKSMPRKPLAAKLLSQADH